MGREGGREGGMLSSSFPPSFLFLCFFELGELRSTYPYELTLFYDLTTMERCPKSPS